MKPACLLLATVVILSAVLLAPVRGERFVLKGGGEVSGEVLNPKQIPRTDYRVRTADGVVVMIDREQVVKKVFERSVEAEYERVWPRFADTVEDQWKLAEWCRENTLLEQREFHMERVVHLDPAHEAARRALGFIQRNGRWTTRDEELRDQGYVYFEGDWRTSQEIQLIEEDRQSVSVHREWIQKLKGYHDQLVSGHVNEARRAILEMRDPAAIMALGLALKDEPNPSIRELYLSALGNLNTRQAAMLLAAAYMNEPIGDLRLTCLDNLKGSHDAVDYFVANLGNGNNGAVNRAGFALGYLEDPSAIGPLINALYTVHKVLVKEGGGAGQYAPSFGSNGNAGFSAGGSEKIFNVSRENRAVLEALVKLTNESYGFDVARWKIWHAGQRRYEHVNARRD